MKCIIIEFQAVIYDNEILTESKEYSSIASRAHLLSNLFDILFSHFMSKRNVRENDFNSSSSENNTINIDRISNIIQMIDNTRDIRPNLRRLFPPAGVETVQGPNVLTLTAATTAIHALESLLKNSDESYTVNKLINQIDNLDIKTRIQSKKDNSDKDNSNKDESNGNDYVIIPLDDLHFGLINTVSLLCQLRSFQKGVPVPLSWVMTMVYKHCLDLTTTGDHTVHSTWLH